MKNRDSFRGTSIDDAFCKAFKNTKFYTDAYCLHKDEIIIGVRDGYINLYYNCDSIAKIDVSSPNEATIDSYYTSGAKATILDDEFMSYYNLIKRNSDQRSKNEKQAQENLFIANNSNPLSKWFCIDLEYTKSLKGKEQAEDWRFDIIAITREAPFRVALIELKYGKGALKEPSGIRSHVLDFYGFHKRNDFVKLKPEIISIIHKLVSLGIDVPERLRNIKESDIQSTPEYYFITLNNNPGGQNASTPKQTMSGYLFEDKRWGCKRVSSLVKKSGDYYTITENSKTFKPIFLFSKANLPNLLINDILDSCNYEVLTV